MKQSDQDVEFEKQAESLYEKLREQDEKLHNQPQDLTGKPNAFVSFHTPEEVALFRKLKQHNGKLIDKNTKVMVTAPDGTKYCVRGDIWLQREKEKKQ